MCLLLITKHHCNGRPPNWQVNGILALGPMISVPQGGAFSDFSLLFEVFLFPLTVSF